LQDAEVLATGQKTAPDPDGKPVTATVVTILVSPDDAQRVVLASTQGIVRFVLRNGADRLDFTGQPVLLSQLTPAPPLPPKAQKPAPAPPKPYTVETFMGGTVKTDNFQ
jgi:pilus assembly protein CpaB